MTDLIRFRIHLIYSANGMKRPLSFRQVVPAVNVTEAIQLASNFVRTAYESGFVVHTWTAENLDKRVEVKYVGGEFAEEGSCGACGGSLGRDGARGEAGN